MSNSHGDLTILLVTDMAYDKYLKPMINSLTRNSLDSIKEVHIHLVNHPQAHIWIKELSPIPTTFSYSNLELDDIQLLDKNKALKVTEKKCYCANIRIKVIEELLKQGHTKIVYIDIDSLVRKSLKDLSIILDNNDISFRYLDLNGPKRRVMTGIIAIANTTGSQKLIREFNDKFQNNYCQWGTDQKYLTELFDQYQDSLKIKLLSNSFLDWEFQSNSVIWTAKGPRKNNNKYLKEEQIYNI